MKSSGQSIKEWVGQKVRVAVVNVGSGDPGRFECTLEGVDDIGIVVSYEKNDLKITRFHPWHSVPYINLGSIEHRPRRAGF